MMSINLNDIANLNIHGVNYLCIISGINKNESINLLKNVNLTAKKETFLLRIKHLDLDTQNKQLSNMASPCDKNYNFFIGYKDDDIILNHYA